MSTQQDYGGEIADVVEKIRLQEEADQQAATTTSTSEQTAGTGTTESTEGTTEGQGTTPTEGSTAAAAPAPGTTDQHGDVRGALRASRRAERQSRERAERLEAELEETRKRIPAIADEGVSDAELAELEADMPVVAKALREVRAAKAATPPAPAPAPQAQPEFIPPVQAAHVQDVIDDIPALLEMQNDPDQSRFDLAVQTDALLKKHPAWHDKPLGERLAECARRVNADLGTAAPAAPAPAPQSPAAAPAPATRRSPAAAVAQAPVVHPTTLSDIAGGAAPTTATPGLKQFMNMSNEDIMRELERHG
jgi:hypothetical protein